MFLSWLGLVWMLQNRASRAMRVYTRTSIYIYLYADRRPEPCLDLLLHVFHSIRKAGQTKVMRTPFHKLTPYVFKRRVPHAYLLCIVAAV